MYTIHIYEKITDNFAGKINVVDGRTPNEVMSVFGLTANFEVDGKPLDGDYVVSDKTDIIAYVVAQGGKGAGLGQLLIGGTLIGASTFFTGGLATGLMTAGIGNSVSGGLTYLLGGASYQSDNSLVSGSNYEPPKLNLKNEIAKYDEPIGEIFGTHLITPKMLDKNFHYRIYDNTQPYKFQDKIYQRYYFHLGKKILKGYTSNDSFKVNNVWLGEEQLEDVTLSTGVGYRTGFTDFAGTGSLERFNLNRPFTISSGGSSSLVDDESTTELIKFRDDDDLRNGKLVYTFFVPKKTNNKTIFSLEFKVYFYDDSDTIVSGETITFEENDIFQYGDYCYYEYDISSISGISKTKVQLTSVNINGTNTYFGGQEFPSSKPYILSVDFIDESSPIGISSPSPGLQTDEGLLVDLVSYQGESYNDVSLNEDENEINISAEVQALSYVKTGVNTYTYGYTNNPAGALLKVLKGSSNFKPVDDANIDYDSIDDFWDHCETNGFEFNYVASKTRKVSELIKLILASGMASYSTPEGVFKVVIDKAGKQTTGIVSNRNSFSASSSQNTNEKTIPEAYKVSYIDELYRWKENEFIVYADGFDSSNATNIIPFSMAGVTKQTQISYIAKVMLASARLRNETYKVNLSLDNMYLSRGDIVNYQEQFLQSQLYSARIRDLFINPSSGLVIGFKMDDYYDFGDFDHSVVIRNNTGNAVQIVNITQRNENTNLIGFDSAELSTSLVNEGNLFTIGVRGSEVTKCMVADIKPNSDLTASVMLMPYAEEIFTQTGDSNTSIVNVPNNKNSIINSSVQIQINNIIDGIREENNLITESEEDILTEDGELILV